MEIKMIACDNPSCKETGLPEWISANGKSHNPPYGWLFIEGGFFGCGPYFQKRKGLEVCSLECLVPAIEEVVRKEHE